MNWGKSGTDATEIESRKNTRLSGLSLTEDVEAMAEEQIDLSRENGLN
jgi:hypothetical protein